MIYNDGQVGRVARAIPLSGCLGMGAGLWQVRELFIYSNWGEGRVCREAEIASSLAVTLETGSSSE